MFPSVILESSCLFSPRLLSVCWAPAGYWQPRLARISRILAVFGFSSPILETHQLVYLVLWSHRYTDPHKCFQSHRVRDFRTGQSYNRMIKIASLCAGWWTLAMSVSDLLRPIKTELGVASRVTTCYKDLVQGLNRAWRKPTYISQTRKTIGGEQNLKPKIHTMMKKYFAPILTVAKKSQNVQVIIDPDLPKN